MSTATVKAITAEEIDEAFENGEDMRKYFDFSTAQVIHPEEKKPVNLVLPTWLIRVLDEEAERRATSRRAVANDWLVDRADQELAKRRASA